MRIEPATPADIDEVAALYDALIDHLESTVNYPGWRKGLYPTRETAQAAADNGTLYVAREEGGIIGSIVLSHRPEAAYGEGRWGIDASYDDIIVIHTLSVRPDHLKHGVARRLMEFAAQFARQRAMKAIRLDVSERNLPAIALYEKCGYRCVGTVDLRLGIPGMKWYRLYELVL